MTEQEKINCINRRKYIKKGDFSKLDVNFDKAYFGKKTLQIIASFVGGIPLAYVSYIMGYPVATISLVVTMLGLARAGVLDILLAVIYNKEKENNDNETNIENKLIK